MSHLYKGKNLILQIMRSLDRLILLRLNKLIVRRAIREYPYNQGKRLKYRYQMTRKKMSLSSLQLKKSKIMNELL